MPHQSPTPILLEKNGNIFLSDEDTTGNPCRYLGFLPSGPENLWQPYSSFAFTPDLMRNGRSGWILFLEQRPADSGSFAAHLRQHLPKGFTAGAIWASGAADGEPTLVVPFAGVHELAEADGVTGQSQPFDLDLIPGESELQAPPCRMIWATAQPNWIRLEAAEPQRVVVKLGESTITTSRMVMSADARKGTLIVQRLRLDQVPLVLSYVLHDRRLDYPLLAPGRSLLVDLDATVLDPTHSFFELLLTDTQGRPVLDSAWRSPEGEALQLVPSNAAGPGLQSSANRWSPGFTRLLLLEGPRLEPMGDFLLLWPEGGSVGEILCGLDANELIHFQQDDPSRPDALLRFVPGGAAEFPPPEAGGHSTSWIDPRGASPTYMGDAQVLYGGEGPFLDPVAAGGLSLPTADGRGFPMVPYAEVDDQIEARTALERQLLSLIRSDRVLHGTASEEVAPAHGTSRRSVTTGILTTAQGMLLELENGAVVGLEIARVAGQILRIAPLSSALQQALNARTLTVVCDSGGLLGTVQGALDLGGWGFDLSELLGSPAEGAIAVFKFSGNRLTDIARSTALWTQASSFSPNPAALQARLAQLVDAGVAAADGGDPRWQGFGGLARNAEWQGVLLFEARLSMADLPEVVSSLAAGLQGVVLSADYLALQLGQVAQVAGAWVQGDSSVSGILSYTNGAAAPEPGANGDATLTVRMLEVAFAESVPDAVSVEVDVGIARLFDAEVQGGALSLSGRVSMVGGVQRLSLQAASPASFTSQGIVKRVTIDTARMSTELRTSSDRGVRASLELAGSMAFQQLPIDVFSFDSLDFSGLRFDLEVPLEGASFGIPSVDFDASTLSVVVSTAQKRPDSLASNFPLRITGFAVQPQGINIGAMGFLDLGILGEAGTPTFALTAEVALGSAGGQARGTSAFVAELLLGWDPTRLGAPSLGLKLPGGGGRKSIGLQGIFELSLEELALERVSDGQGHDLFAIKLDKAQLHVFNRPFPASRQLSALLYAPLTAANGSQAPLGWWFAVPRVGDAPEGALFDVGFLGLGQRVKFTPQTGVQANLDALGSLLDAPLSQLYDPNGSWLLGAQFDVAGGVEVGLVFMDPRVYGLSLRITSATMPNVAGEVSYQRLSNGVGLFSGSVAVRGANGRGAGTIQLGVASLTLPSLAMDYWTNGEFRFNLGYSSDISRLSVVGARLEINGIIGAGGLYVAKLSQQNAQGLPSLSRAPQGAEFSPVLEAGLALTIGVGKSVSAGIFKGSASATVTGILSGAVAWYQADSRHPSLSLGSNNWYKVQGTVGLDIRLSGSVDLYVASASVDLRTSASTTLTYEAYKDFTVRLRAQLSGSANVKVGWWTRSKSFSFSLDETITIARSTRTAPWMGGRATRSLEESVDGSISWSARQVFASPRPLSLLLSAEPTFSPIEGGSQPLAVVALQLDASTTGAAWSPLTSGAESSLSSLYAGLLGWLVACAEDIEDPESLWAWSASVESLDAIQARLDATDTLALSTELVLSFLASSFVTQINPLDDTRPDLVVLSLPLPPTVSLVSSEAVSSDLSTRDRRDVNWGPALLAWREGEAVPDQVPDADDPTAASWVFRDLLALGLRASLDQARSLAQDQEAGWSTDRASLASLLSQGGELENAAGMVSAMCAGGQQVAAANPVLADDPAALGLALQTGVGLPVQRWTGWSVELRQAVANAWPALAAPVRYAPPQSPEWSDSFPAGSSAFQIDAALTGGFVEGPTRLGLGGLSRWTRQPSEQAGLVAVVPAVAARLGASPAEGSIRYTWVAPDGSAHTETAAVAAAKVVLTLSAAIGPDGMSLANVFSIGGCAPEDRATLDALRAAVDAGQAGNLRASLAVVGADGITSPETEAGTLLFRTDLDTVSRPSRKRSFDEAPAGPPPKDSASLEDLAAFLDLLWAEAVTSDGGTWLLRPDQADGSNDLRALLAAGGEPRIALVVVSDLVGAPWMNAALPEGAVEALDQDAQLAVELPDERSWTASLRPGEVAVEITRAPAASSDAQETYLRSIFGRAWARVAANTAFGDGAPNNSMPFDSTERAQVVLPANRWALGADSSPYAQVGQPLRLAVGLVDDCGDALGETLVEGTVAWSDPLVALGTWPRAEFSWSLDGSNPGEPVLRGRIQLHLAALTTEEQAPVRDSYTLIKQQLAAVGGVDGQTATLTSSLGGSADSLAALRQVVADALTQLASPTPASVEQPLGDLSPEWAAITELAFIEVWLDLERRADLLAPEAPESVRTSRVALSPAEGDADLATTVQDALGRLRLLRAPTGALALSPLGSGLDLQPAAAPPLLYAMPPLATEELGLVEVAVKSWPEGASELINLVAFDLDAALRDVLGSLDALSLPGVAARAASSADTADSWAAVMAARRGIAAGLAARVQLLLAGSEDTPIAQGIARGIFEQRLLGDLSDAVSVSAVVLLPIDIHSSDLGGWAPSALYGSVSLGDQPDATGQGSVSTEARIPLAEGTWWLGFAWSRPAGSDPTRIALTPSFQWTHLEHGIEEREVNGQIYTSGDWLLSVLGSEPEDGWGMVEIPVWPLDRAAGGGVTGTATMDPAAWSGDPADAAGLGWTYTLVADTHSRSTLRVDLALNAGPAATPVRSSEEPDLADALVRCAVELPWIATALGATDPAAWARLAELAGLVAQGLPGWGTAPVAGRPQILPESPLSWSYTLEFEEELIRITPDGSAPLPLLGQDDGAPIPDQGGSWTRVGDPSRLSLAWPGLDPRNLEGARGAITPQIPAGGQLLPGFVPTVPAAVAGASSSPQAKILTPLDLGTLAPAQLGAQLQEALYALLSVEPLGQPLRGLRVEASLHVDQGGGAEVAFPLVLAPTLLVTLPEVTVEGVGLGQTIAAALVAARADLSGRLVIRLGWLGGAESRARALFELEVDALLA